MEVTILFSHHLKRMSNRSNMRSDKKEIKRDKFSPCEDAMIFKLVEKHGVSNWDKISRDFGPSRVKRQLRERWQNYLDPDNNPVYTKEEDELLLDCFEKYGSKWAQIAAIIGKKSAISTRNRYRTLMSYKRKGVEPKYENIESQSSSPAPTPSSSDVNVFSFEQNDVGQEMLYDDVVDIDLGLFGIDLNDVAQEEWFLNDDNFTLY